MVSSEVVRLGDFVFELRLRDQGEEKCRKRGNLRHAYVSCTQKFHGSKDFCTVGSSTLRRKLARRRVKSNAIPYLLNSARKKTCQHLYTARKTAQVIHSGFPGFEAPAKPVQIVLQNVPYSWNQKMSNHSTILNVWQRCEAFKGISFHCISCGPELNIFFVSSVHV